MENFITPKLHRKYALANMAILEILIMFWKNYTERKMENFFCTSVEDLPADIVYKQVATNIVAFNPRIHKGYDKAHKKRKNKLSALIPVSVKGTTSFITREIINDMF